MLDEELRDALGGAAPFLEAVMEGIKKGLDNTPEKVPTKLFHYRMIRKMTQKALSEKSGINQMQISRIERGDIKMRNVSLVNAVALAKALNIKAEDLLEDEDPK